MMFVYSLDPIDWWFGWLSEAEFQERIFDEFRSDVGQATDEWKRYLSFKAKAFDLAKQIGWEGDIRGGDAPRVAAVACDNGGGSYVLAWKQDNNGITFVASPVQLPWLEDGRLRVEG